MNLINLPIEIYATIGTYLNYSDIYKIPHVDNPRFWNIYLQIKHSQIINYKLIGDPIGFDKILSYYKTADFNKLTPENKKYDDAVSTITTNIIDMIKLIKDGSKYHYDSINKLYTEYPNEFKILLKYELLRREDHGYLISLLDDLDEIRKYYLEYYFTEYTLQRLKERLDYTIHHLNMVKSVISDFSTTLSNLDINSFHYTDQREMLIERIDMFTGYLYIYLFCIKVYENLIKIMDHFNIESI
jgi:hypothetical protein